MGGPGLEELLAILGFKVESLDQYELDDLLFARKGLKQLQKVLFDQKTGFDKLMGDEIVARMMAEGEIEHAMADGYVARLCTGRTASSLSELRLVEQGVDAQVIANSRVEGREYVYVEIRKKKEK